MTFDLKKQQIEHLIFHFYFLNSDISIIIELTVIPFYTDVKNISVEGTVSQIFYLGLSLYFI